MSKTKIGVIYAAKSKLLQRIYIPHADDAEIDVQHVGSGETLVKMPIENYYREGPPGIQKAIGEPTISGRCAVVHKDTGQVIDYIMADPELYVHPDGHRLIPLKDR